MKALRSLAVASALAVLAQPVIAPAQESVTPVSKQEQKLTIERVFASPSLDGQTPRLPKLSPDGRYLTVLRNRASDRERYDLWAYDRQDGQWRMLVDSEKLGSGRELSEAEKMQRERQRLAGLKGIVTYDWSADGKSILVPVEGDLYLAGLDGSVKRLTNSPEGQLNPVLSESGKYVSFVRRRRLWTGLVGGEAKAVTPEESADTVHWGEAEFVAQEEMDRFTGYWWSPTDARIAVERFDEAPVGVVTRAAIGASGTKTFEQRYPAAGTPNVDVSLFVIDPDGGNKVQVDLGPERDIYLTRVDWAPDGKTLYAQRVDRCQTRLDMLEVDPATGKSHVLFSEKAAPNHWINLSDSYRFLKDGSLIWWSERDGFGHLYRFAGGKWRQLTKGPWVVTKLAGVDQQAHRLFFTATKDDVLAPQVYSLDYLKPDEVQRLTDLAFANGASMDKQGKTILVSRSSPSQPPQTYLADDTGKQLAWVEENKLDASHPYAPYLASHRLPQFGTIKGPDGTTLHWKMITPPLVAGKRYPVFFSHYGGPHSQEVSKAWGGALSQAIVAKGYIFFEIDNRGKVRLSMRVVDQETGEELEDTRPPREPREPRGDRGDRGDRRGPRGDRGGRDRDRGPRRDDRGDRGPRGEGRREREPEGDPNHMPAFLKDD